MKNAVIQAAWRALLLANSAGLTLDPHQRKVRALRNLHRGRRAFVLGNGPSLCVPDLDRLQGEVTFASNKIFLCFDQTAWRPTYYSVEDPLVMEQNLESIHALTGTTKLFTHLFRGVYTGKDATFFKQLAVPIEGRKPGFSRNAVRGVYWGSSVSYSMLQLAVHMGCSPIYLLGMDFSFSVPQKVLGVDPWGHAIYESAGEVNHFHPDYRKAGEKWYAPNLDKQLLAFQAAAEACDRHGIQVLNATRGGKLEVFPRVEIDSLFR